MAIGDVFRLKLIWRKTTTSPAAVNDFYFKQLDTLILDTPEEDLWEAFETEIIPQLTQLITNQLALVQVQIGLAPLFLTSFVLDNPPISGTASGDALPARTCGLLAYRTADLTRRGRGRVFLPPSSETLNGASGAPSSAYITQMEVVHSALAALASGTISYAGWQHCLWSVADQAAKDVTQYVSRGYWGHQGDRKNILA